MSKIRIKNFGPIKSGRLDNEGWLEIKKVTVFIGDQASGKSTIAKLISTFTWLEKTLYRGDINTVTSEEFTEDYCSYYRMSDFFKHDSEIFFEGDYYIFKFLDGLFEFHAISTDRQIEVPKIMYVPAERNFLSTVKNADEVKGLPRPLFTFLDEYERSLNEIKGVIPLPIKRLHFEYNKFLKTGYIIGEDYRVKLLDASSGLHSLVPLFLVTRNLSLAIINKENDPSKSNLSYKQEQRKRAQIQDMTLKFISEHSFKNTDENHADDIYNRQLAIIESKYINSRFVNIVEEPEQNLYPISQRAILNNLLSSNSYKNNTLVITTHSPYLINDITLCVEAFNLLEKINGARGEAELKSKIANIVPLASVVAPVDLAIYELDEKEGSIKLLENYDGLPSDENKLNEKLGEGNELFAQLLEILQQYKHANPEKN